MAFIGDPDQWGTYFIVNSKIYKHFKKHCFVAKLVSVIDRQGGIFLWPLKVGEKGSGKAWNNSAREVARQAESEWVQLISNGNYYDSNTIDGEFTKPEEPKWPNKNLYQLTQIAVKHMLVDAVDHPTIQRIRGRL